MVITADVVDQRYHPIVPIADITTSGGAQRHDNGKMEV